MLIKLQGILNTDMQIYLSQRGDILYFLTLPTPTLQLWSCDLNLTLRKNKSHQISQPLAWNLPVPGPGLSSVPVLLHDVLLHLGHSVTFSSTLFLQLLASSALFLPAYWVIPSPTESYLCLWSLKQATPPPHLSFQLVPTSPLPCRIRNLQKVIYIHYLNFTFLFWFISL
jgi:hypothetical protein